MNENGGFHPVGMPCSYGKKVEVMEPILHLHEKHAGVNLNVRSLAEAVKGGRMFANKVIEEIAIHGAIIDPRSITRNGPLVLAALH